MSSIGVGSRWPARAPTASGHGRFAPGTALGETANEMVCPAWYGLPSTPISPGKQVSQCSCPPSRCARARMLHSSQTPAPGQCRPGPRGPATDARMARGREVGHKCRVPSLLRCCSELVSFYPARPRPGAQGPRRSVARLTAARRSVRLTGPSMEASGHEEAGCAKDAADRPFFTLPRTFR